MASDYVSAFAAEFSASGEEASVASSLGSGAVSGAVAVAGKAIAETDAAKQALAYGEAALSGAAAGAAAGAICGPAAPLCSSIGAIAGALIALGIELAKSFDSTVDTVPCTVIDFSPVSRRCSENPDGSLSEAWSIAPFGIEQKFWATRNPDFPPGLTLGFVLWCARRIREDGLGIEYWARLANAMGIPAGSGGKRFSGKIPGPEVLASEARKLQSSELGNVLGRYGKGDSKFFIGVATARAGGSIKDIHKALGTKISGGEILRYDRTRKQLDAEFSKRFGASAGGSAFGGLARLPLPVKLAVGAGLVIALRKW